MSLNGITSSIIKLFSTYDSAGKSEAQIDTILEYNMLGQYLSGGYVKGAQIKYSELSDSDKNVLQKLYASLKDKFANIAADSFNLPQITVDNASEYVELIQMLYSKNNLSDSEQLTLKKIQTELYKFVVDNGYDLTDMEPEECDYNFIIKQVLEMIETKKKREVSAEKTLQSVNNPYDSSKLKSKAEAYIKENNIQPLTSSPEGVDLGNGKFDKSATQETNVCWALASINTLLTSEKGRQLLESNCYYDKSTGVFAIHLQEAEDNGLHDGIYIITPEEIMAEDGNLAVGEGDAMAYLIAIKKYFTEVNQNPELAEQMELEKHAVRSLDDGNYGFRFFEILTGGKYSKYNYQDVNKPIQNGIGVGEPAAVGGFDEICKLMENKTGAITMVIGEHSISVVGVRDGKLIVQESNNSDDFAEEYTDFQRNHVLFNRIEDINGAPAYELSKEDYYGYIRSVSFIKW